MNSTKIMIISAAVIGSLGLTALGIGSAALAQTTDTSDYPLIIQRLAETFNLEPEAVETVFEETEDERELDRLNALVENEVITEAQRDLIVEKMTAYEAQIEELDNQQLTADDRMSAMQDLRDELKSWADENDIPMMALGGFGMRGGHGSEPGGPHGMGMNEMGMGGNGTGMQGTGGICPNDTETE